MTSPLPVSARLAWWGTSWLRGVTSPDELIDAVQAGGLPQVVAGLSIDETPSLMAALAQLRDRGATALGAAFPVEGDPVGLGGPPDFNKLALEAGEAVVVTGADLGLVPQPIGPTYIWSAVGAGRRQLPDVGEADRSLRSALLESADALAALDVARWRPEVADLLLDLRHHGALDAPPDVPSRCVDLAARGLQATGIATLALDDDGGALTAYEIAARRAAITPLDRAGRRALTAACSPEVWPPAAVVP